MFRTSHARCRLVLSTAVVNGWLIIHNVGLVHSCTNTANSCLIDSCHIFISVFKALTPNFNFSRSPFLFLATLIPRPPHAPRHKHWNYAGVESLFFFFSCDPGTKPAAKKWRGLINIHESWLYCNCVCTWLLKCWLYYSSCMLHARSRIFD